MWSNKQQIQLERILNHPGLRFRKVSKYKYLINYKYRKWYLLPRSGRYQKISSNGAVSEIFMGELSDFYHQYLTEELDLPENFGKTWSKDDDEVLDNRPHSGDVWGVKLDFDRISSKVQLYSNKTHRRGFIAMLLLLIP